MVKAITYSSILFMVVLVVNSAIGINIFGGKKRKATEPIPRNMVFINGGNFTAGSNDEDITHSISQNKSITVGSFWMSETEVTNAEYREFLIWVRDSIARERLGQSDPEFVIEQDKNGNPIPRRINWKPKVDWNNTEMLLSMGDLILPPDQLSPEADPTDPLFNINRELLIFKYKKIDLQKAAKNPFANPDTYSDLIEINVFPDNYCWIRDYPETFSSTPIGERYFSAPDTDNFPVVGVTWKQAIAFCEWKSMLEMKETSSRGEAPAAKYRLPSEAEWEYAARGGIKSGVYPWGGFYTRDEMGCFRANFKYMRGRYVSGTGGMTMEAKSFDPNDYGLYDMAGNVSEWTSSSYDELGYLTLTDFNPQNQYDAKESDSPALKRKVIRGGSWKDVKYFLRVGSRAYEYQDTTKCYIGFRYVKSSYSVKNQN